MSEEIYLHQIVRDENVSEVYSDDDIVIIDNVRKLVEPTPARLQMNMLVICTSGKGQGSINGVPISIRRNQVAVCPPNVTLSDFMISPDFEFKAMFFTTRILQSFLREKKHEVL